jgi:hypothetical protein
MKTGGNFKSHARHRNVLYWTPDIKKNVKENRELLFIVQMFRANYAVVIQGISEDGRTGSKVIEFEVKNRRNDFTAVNKR